MKKATTAKVTREPCQCLVHSCPDLLVAGIPVVRQVVLPKDVAEDCSTAKLKLKCTVEPQERDKTSLQGTLSNVNFLCQVCSRQKRSNSTLIQIPFEMVGEFICLLSCIRTRNYNIPLVTHYVSHPLSHDRSTNFGYFEF